MRNEVSLYALAYIQENSNPYTVFCNLIQYVLYKSKEKHIFKYWNSTPIAKLNLSSVGIIIGAFAVENITNYVFDLSIWI